MIVHCTSCRAKFRIADEKIGPRGAKARCSRCETVFAVHRDLGAMPLAVDPRSAPPAGAPSEPPERAAVASRPAAPLDVRSRESRARRPPASGSVRVPADPRRPEAALRGAGSLRSGARPARERGRPLRLDPADAGRARAARRVRRSVPAARGAPSRRATRAPIRSASRRRVPLGRTSTRPTRPLRRHPFPAAAPFAGAPDPFAAAPSPSARGLPLTDLSDLLGAGPGSPAARRPHRSPVPISRSRTAPRRRRSARPASHATSPSAT